MKNRLSLIICILISLFLLNNRLNRSEYRSAAPINITTWDALGYYMYLPAYFIYKDAKKLEWLDAVDKKYNLTGGYLYQAQKAPNGNYFLKYLGGVSILQMPFFFMGHQIAKRSSRYEADGFAAPYQWCIGFGVIVYCILALFLLRRILLRYYNDWVTAFTLLLLMLATNVVQYICYDSAMSHAYIFPLYVLLIYATIRWHEKPSWVWAVIAGLTMGLATISRPTEAIMFLIPMLWGTNSKENAKLKWQLVKENRLHILYAGIAGFLAILPQLLYWKHVTGSFVFDVGSAWDFLTPHLRVLFGWEKGWFIYTPITIFFIAGMFFFKNMPFKKAVLWFCLLNIYIIISWRDWRYGGSYSTRALVQSYPIFALPFAAFINWIWQKNKVWKFSFLALGVFLIYVNQIQIDQYHSKVLHYNDMNRKYYARAYLNKTPSPLEMSLFDNPDWMRNENKFSLIKKVSMDSTYSFNSPIGATNVFFEQNLSEIYQDPSKKAVWLKVKADVLLRSGYSKTFLKTEIKANDHSKINQVRIFRPLALAGEYNSYEFYIKIPKDLQQGKLSIFTQAEGHSTGSVKNLSLNYFNSK